MAGPKQIRYLKIALGALVTIAVGTYLVIDGLLPALIYSHPVEDLLREPAAFVGRSVKIEGKVVPASIESRTSPTLEYRFRVTSKDPAVPGELVVHHVGILPDTIWVAGAEVVVKGNLPAVGSDFESEHVLAKCPSKYEGEDVPDGYIVPKNGNRLPES